MKLAGGRLSSLLVSDVILLGFFSRLTPLVGYAGEMISHRNLPQSLIAPCLDVLSKISTSERDLIRIIVDVVTELRSTYTEAREDDSVRKTRFRLPHRYLNNIASILR
jgi:hypothetical protein